MTSDPLETEAPGPSSAPRSIALDVETVSDWDAVPADVQAALLERHRAAEAKLPEDQRGQPGAGPDARAALSPWTARVVVVALYDAAKGRGLALYEDPDTAVPTVASPWQFRPVADEATLLRATWAMLARHPDARVSSFNGRRFDGPMLMTRSLACGVRASRNLVPYRYSTREHLDLWDVLGFWGDGRCPPLGVVAPLLGLPSPKDGGLDGAKVEAAWRAGRRLEVARYCARDAETVAAIEAAWERSLGGVFGERRKW